MICKKPYREGIHEYGCGQCAPCRIKKSSMWTGRMLLESYEHPASVFVTLTYDDTHVPKDGCLRKKDLQDFIKRLRWEVSPRKIRYYGVGEYGEGFGRPHYHCIVFGMSTLEEESIKKAWMDSGYSIGYVYVGTVESASVSYVLGYMMKRLTVDNEYTRRKLNGKALEFAVMSRKPGIGFGVVERFIRAYNTNGGKEAIKKIGWIAEMFRTEKTAYHVGRYLKGKILERLGYEKGDIEAHNELQKLFKYEKDYGSKTFKELIDSGESEREKRAAKVEQQEGKIRLLLDRRKTL